MYGFILIRGWKEWISSKILCVRKPQHMQQCTIELMNVLFSDLKPVASKASAQLKSLTAFILKRRTKFSNLLLGYVTILCFPEVWTRDGGSAAVSPVRLRYVLVKAGR